MVHHCDVNVPPIANGLLQYVKLTVLVKVRENLA